MNEIKITVLYFASLAQMAKIDEEIMTIQTTKQTADLSQLYQSLKDKYQFTLTQDKLAVAINHEFVDWNTQIHNGDVVAFIPPVAGG